MSNACQMATYAPDLSDQPNHEYNEEGPDEGYLIDRESQYHKGYQREGYQHPRQHPTDHDEHKQAVVLAHGETVRRVTRQPVYQANPTAQPETQPKG